MFGLESSLELTSDKATLRLPHLQASEEMILNKLCAARKTTSIQGTGYFNKVMHKTVFTSNKQTMFTNGVGNVERLEASVQPL